jgi:hypothetical protein
MKPAPGRYRLTGSQPPTPPTFCVVEITEDGMVTPFGYLPWVDEPPTPGAFISGSQTVTFTTATDYVSHNGTGWSSGTYQRV